MKSAVWFVIVIHAPDIPLLTRVLGALRLYSVVIVDNRDPVDREKPIPHQKNIQFLSPKGNLGYTGGNNFGARYALDHGADWVVILNDDLEMSASGIDRCVSKLEGSEPGLAGPFTGMLDPKRGTTIFDPSGSRHQSFAYISGSFLAVHRAVVEKLGYLFYDPYFLYYEDVELSIRASRLGFPLRQIAVPGLKHRSSMTFGAGSARQHYYMARNHLFFVRRNAPIRIVIREFIRLPKTLYEHFRRGDYGAYRGVIDFLRGRFGRQEASV